MWFKSKYDKLTREEVVDSICKLEQEEKDIEDGLILKNKQIEELMQKGKAEKSKDIQLFYAKKNGPKTRSVWQGRHDSNAQPAVLETAALPLSHSPKTTCFSLMVGLHYVKCNVIIVSINILNNKRGKQI